VEGTGDTNSPTSNSFVLLYDPDAADTTPPVITLNGAATIDLTVGDTFTDPGATANDDVDGDLTNDIAVGGDAVDTNTAGTYVITYNVSDAAGNAATEVTRTVNVNPAQTVDLTGNLTLQGRYATQQLPADHSGDFTLELYQSGNLVDTFTVTTDASGQFTLFDMQVAAGTYEMKIKHDQYLSTVETVTLAVGNNTVDFGEQAAGDANNDNQVSALDFSILAGTFNLSQGQPGYDARADFNGSGNVSAQDFSLLASNFNTAGEEPQN
jgi:hypothetical protein